MTAAYFDQNPDKRQFSELSILANPLHPQACGRERIVFLTNAVKLLVAVVVVVAAAVAVPLSAVEKVHEGESAAAYCAAFRLNGTAKPNRFLRLYQIYQRMRLSRTIRADSKVQPPLGLRWAKGALQPIPTR